MAGSDDFGMRSKLMNLPVPGLNVFHPYSQEILDRPEHSITLRENVQRDCRNSPAFKQRFKTPQRLQWPAWYWHNVVALLVSKNIAFMSTVRFSPHFPEELSTVTHVYQLQFNLTFQGSKWLLSRTPFLEPVLVDEVQSVLTNKSHFRGTS